MPPPTPRRHSGDGGEPPPPRRPRPGAADGGDPDSIAAAQARAGRKATQGRSGTSSGSDSTGGGDSGPPWPTVDGVAGSARGRDLNPPHQRHTIVGARNGLVDEENTIYLRGYEGFAATDVQGIAAGEGVWNPASQRYEINGRSYGVEPNGRVFPDSGDGMVKLDRNEYAALKEIARAGGDLTAAPQLSRNPRFTANPDAVAKAKAIYDGTYEP